MTDKQETADERGARYRQNLQSWVAKARNGYAAPYPISLFATFGEEASGVWKKCKVCKCRIPDVPDAHYIVRTIEEIPRVVWAMRRFERALINTVFIHPELLLANLEEILTEHLRCQDTFEDCADILEKREKSQAKRSHKN